jgi:hypothetical protein
MNCVKMRRASAKEKRCLLYFSPYTLLLLRSLRAKKTSLGPERRLRLVVLEDAVALTCVAKRKGANQDRYTILYFYHSGFTAGRRLDHVSNTTQSFNLILNRRDGFQIICDGKSVFPSHVFEAMRRSLEDFGVAYYGFERLQYYVFLLLTA